MVNETCEVAARLLDAYAPVDIASERYTEREPHPGGQEAFSIRARFPWQSRPQTRVMIEVTMDERVLLPAERRQVMHDYGEPLNAGVNVYPLKEIMAEKLRALLQQARMSEMRGWSRSRARDYYDLRRVLGTYRKQMDLAGFDALLEEKCAVRGVDFAGPEDFFHKEMLAYVEATWELWLGPLVPGLPPFETVIDGLRPQIEMLVSSDG